MPTIAQTIENRMEEKRVVIEEAVDTIMNEINSMGSEREVGEIIRDKVLQSHRTLQQRFFADVIIPIIQGFADNEFVDARNEVSKDVACKLINLIKEKNMALLPFI